MTCVLLRKLYIKKEPLDFQWGSNHINSHAILFAGIRQKSGGNRYLKQTQDVSRPVVIPTWTLGREGRRILGSWFFWFARAKEIHNSDYETYDSPNFHIREIVHCLNSSKKCGYDADNYRYLGKLK